MEQIATLSNDINIITAEINSYKQVAGQAIFEIGRRLKWVKENDLIHGEWEKWLKENVQFSRMQANRFIQSYEQFGNLNVTMSLQSSKIFEMLQMPDSVNREEFIAQTHTIPSTGEQKTVEEMTVKELREVKKALKQAEDRAKKAESESVHYQKLWNQEKNKQPKIVNKEIVPSDYEESKKIAARLNDENIKLVRTNKELALQLAENKSTLTSIRKLKDYCSESLRTLIATNNALLFELETLNGNREAHNIVVQYEEKLKVEISSFLKKLDDLISVKTIYEE